MKTAVGLPSFSALLVRRLLLKPHSLYHIADISTAWLLSSHFDNHYHRAVVRSYHHFSDTVRCNKGPPYLGGSHRINSSGAVPVNFFQINIKR